MFITCNFNGAMVVIPEGETPNDEDLTFACRLAVRYSKGRDEELVEVKFGKVSNEFTDTEEVKSMTQEELDKYIVN